MLSIILGLIFLGLGLAGLIEWWEMFVYVLMGIAPFCMAFVGVIAIVAGITSIKDSSNAKKDLMKE